MNEATDADPWDEWADGWDDDPAARAYAAAAFDSLREVLGRFGRGLDGLIVCDFGCGTGLLTERLVDTAASIDAIDTSPAMLAALQTKIDRHGWSTVRAAADLADGTGTHDLVVCSSVLSFVDDYPATVERLAALLGSGGVFVQWDWELDPTEEEPHGFDRPTIEHTLESAGLIDVQVDTAFEVEFEGMTMRPLIGFGRRP